MCDCTCSNVICMLNHLSIKPKKIFEYFICFWKWFYTFVFLVFVQNAFLCFSSKTGSEAVLREARNLELLAKCALGKLESHFFIQKVSLLPREYFATKLFLWNVFRKKLENFQFHTRAIATISQLKASHKSFSVSCD